MIKVKRLGHATISTLEIENQTDYYTRVLGLSIIERGKDRVFLGSKQGFEAIELVQGEAAQLKRLSFQIAPGSDLKDVVKSCRNVGIKSEMRQRDFTRRIATPSRSTIPKARPSTSMPNTSSPSPKAFRRSSTS